MDELTALRELRADAPALGTARQVGGHWTLMAAIAAEAELDDTPRRRRNWFPQRVGFRPVIAAGAAAAIISGILVALPGSSDRAQPQTAATILAEAAAYAQSQTVQKPGPNQWVFQDTVYCNPKCTLTPNWVRGDGAKTATEDPWKGGYGHWLADTVGSLDPMRDNPRKAYDLLAALPTDPRDLLESLNAPPYAFLFTSSPPSSPTSTEPPAQLTPSQQWESILWILQYTAVIPADVNAALYRALALIPGVKSVQQPMTDAYGRTATAVSFAEASYNVGWDEQGNMFRQKLNYRYITYLLLDPKTHAYLGSREVRNDKGKPKSVLKEFNRKSAAIVAEPFTVADGTAWKPYPLPAQK